MLHNGPYLPNPIQSNWNSNVKIICMIILIRLMIYDYYGAVVNASAIKRFRPEGHPCQKRHPFTDTEYPFRIGAKFPNWNSFPLNWINRRRRVRQTETTPRTPIVQSTENVFQFFKILQNRNEKKEFISKIEIEIERKGSREKCNQLLRHATLPRPIHQLRPADDIKYHPSLTVFIDQFQPIGFIKQSPKNPQRILKRIPKNPYKWTSPD